MKRTVWLATLAAALAALVYAGGLRHPFVYGDWVSVLANPSIRRLVNLRYILAGSPRPVTNLTYAVNYALSGLNPFGYHLASLAIHVCNVLLLFVFAKRVFEDAGERSSSEWAAFSAAALLAVHPLMTEAVGYSNARAGLLCTMFMLLGMLAMRRRLHGGDARFLVVALISYVVGLGCKETAAMLPFLYLAYDVCFRPGTDGERRRRLRRLHAPLCAFTVAAAAFRLWMLFRLEHGARPGLTHALTQLTVFWRYVLLLFVPFSQSIVRFVADEGARDFRGWLALAGLAVLGVLAFRARRAAPLFAFGVAWFLLLWLPSGALPLGEKMAEHRVYEASLGAFLLFGALLSRLSIRGVVVPLLLAALGATAFARNRVWADSITLWSDAVRKAPESWQAHYALGDAYREAGHCELALAEYAAAAARISTETRVYQNFAICLAAAGRLDEAESQFKAALRIHPTDATIYQNLGVLEAGRRRDSLARNYFEQAIHFNPRYIKPRYELLRLYQTTFKDPERVSRLCHELRELEPIPGAPPAECRAAP